MFPLKKLCRLNTPGRRVLSSCWILSRHIFGYYCNHKTPAGGTGQDTQKYLSDNQYICLNSKPVYLCCIFISAWHKHATKNKQTQKTHTQTNKHSNWKQKKSLPSWSRTRFSKICLYILKVWTHYDTLLIVGITTKSHGIWPKDVTTTLYTTNFYDTKDLQSTDNQQCFSSSESNTAVWQYFQSFHWYHAKKEATVPRQI